MSTKELQDKYNKLYEIMSTSNNPRYMRIFGEAECWAFSQILSYNPRIAEEWLNKIEPVRWNNFVSEKEATEIGSRFVNQDGSTGFHWDMSAFFSIVRQLGGELENEYKYNKYSLWLTANMIYSDHAKSIAEDMGYDAFREVPEEKMALSCYRKSIEKLCDKDRPYFIRPYFEEYLK